MSEYDELVNKLLRGKVGLLTCDDAATAIKKLQARVNMYSAAADKSAVEALKLSTEVERLKGVLGWYADENNWRDQPILRMDHLGRECEDQAPAEIYDDYGVRARSALEVKP